MFIHSRHASHCPCGVPLHSSRLHSSRAGSPAEGLPALWILIGRGKGEEEWQGAERQVAEQERMGEGGDDRSRQGG